MDQVAVARLMERQAGVVARRQVLLAAGIDSDIERLLRRREWARVHPGVYVGHTGPLTWDQRAWAATLVHWPAALSGRSALWAYGVGRPDDRSSVELVVCRTRRVDDPPGVRTSQIGDFGAVARLGLHPPRVTVEHAALTVAARSATEDAAIAVLGDVVQSRRSTPRRLQDALAERPRLRRRRLLEQVLADVAVGANSALERRYLRDVERAHALPRAARQLRVVQGNVSAYRDAAYLPHRTLVELDGRLGHDATSDRWDDLDRDLAAAVAGEVTVRVGWRQVLEPCRLADRIAGLLRTRGWTGGVRACGPACGTGEVLRQPVPENLA